MTDYHRSALRNLARRVLRRVRALRPRKHPNHSLLVREEIAAMQALTQIGGPTVRRAMTDALRRAEGYRHWDGWSLPRPAIVWCAEKIAAYRLAHVVEFGAGYSSVALSEFVLRTSPTTTLDSYEHQSVFADAIRRRLPAGDRIRLHYAPLLQTDDSLFADLLSGAAPADRFRAQARLVPAESQEDTRLRNGFYDLGPDGVAGPPVDMILLDGPNGNGRSLAFPLLASRIAIPCWLIVDDYDHYPFLDDLGRLFEFEVAKTMHMEQVRTILVRIVARKALAQAETV